MKNRLSFEYEDGEVMRYIHEDIAVVKLKGNVFGGMTDLELMEEYFSQYDVLEKDSKINALVTVNEHGIFGEEAYQAFIDEITGTDVSQRTLQNLLEFDKWIFRSREIKVLQRLVMKTLDFSKIFVYGLQGTVVTPFFGLCLAADYRFATEDMCFSLSHVKHELHPSGALAFFLPRYIGQGKAAELLFRGGSINAEQALELGLINAILPREDFEKNCILEAQKLCMDNSNVVQMTKHLLYYYKKELQEYFLRESDLFDLKKH